MANILKQKGITINMILTELSKLQKQAIKHNTDVISVVTISHITCSIFKGYTYINMYYHQEKKCVGGIIDDRGADKECILALKKMQENGYKLGKVLLKLIS